MPPTSHEKSLSAAKLLGMFLLVVGAKFWMIRTCSAPLPIYDQWEAEGQTLLQPWVHGQFHFADLFAPFVQHRIVWTRLLVLGLFALNGQWDTEVQGIAAALIHAGTALALALVLVRRLGRAWEDAVLLGLLLMFGLPLALEETLSGGFASQFYLLMLFGVITVWGLGSHRPGSGAWWAGVAGAVAAWFSVASGPLPALAVAAWMTLRLAGRTGSKRDNWLTLATSLALGGARLCLGYGVSGRDELKARTVGEFAVRFAGLLGWPNFTAWAAPLAFAPFAWLLWRTWRHRRFISPAAAFLIPLGIFFLLNTAGLAYARNHYGDLQVSRYWDLLSYGALINFACLLLFFRETADAPPRTRAGVGLLAAAWVTATGYGLLGLAAHNVADIMPFVKSCSRHEVENVLAFVARPDADKRAAPTAAITLCDNGPLAARLLADPLMVDILPAAARPPIILEAASGSPFVHRVKPDPANDIESAWALEPSPNAQPVHFRSQTLAGVRLPYLSFPRVSGLGDDAFLALVDERSGAATWLQPGPVRHGVSSVLVKTPAGPFHVEAVVAAGADHALVFAYPREVGWLSAWVEPALDTATWFATAGAALWLGAVFWRRLGLGALGGVRVPLPVLTPDRPARATIEAVYTV